MRKVNFNNLDNIEIPDSWADKAIEVSSNPRKDAPLVLYRVSGTLIAVASLVLICTLSITLYFFTQNENVLPVVKPTLNISTTEATDKVLATENSSSAEKVDSNTTETEKPKVLNFESPTSEPQEDIIKPSYSTEKETVKPTQSPSSKPTQNPGIKPSINETFPTEKPTTPTQKPTDNNTGEVLPDIEVPPESVGICEGSFSEDLLLGYDKVYFSIVPDSDYTADEVPEVLNKYEATILSKYNGYVNVSFSPVDTGVVNKTDSYTYYFYNINGDIIYVDEIYITVN